MQEILFLSLYGTPATHREASNNRIKATAGIPTTAGIQTTVGIPITAAGTPYPLLLLSLSVIFLMNLLLLLTLLLWMLLSPLAFLES
jgi:hypothetical protein